MVPKAGRDKSKDCVSVHYHHMSFGIRIDPILLRSHRLREFKRNVVPSTTLEDPYFVQKEKQNESEFVHSLSSDHGMFSGLMYIFSVSVVGDNGDQSV